MTDVRPIDANALMGRIIQRSQGLITPNGEVGYLGLFVKDIQQVVDDAPTINPDDLRPQGRWICKNKAYGEYECSACGGLDTDCSDYYGSHDVTEQDYCPNCGAKMDGKENEDA